MFKKISFTLTLFSLFLILTHTTQNRLLQATQTCPEGQGYSSKEPNCRDCMPKCLKCPNDFMGCDECAEGSYVFSILTGKAPAVSTSYSCLDCSDGCAKCKDGTGHCSECKEGYEMKESDKNKCFKKEVPAFGKIIIVLGLLSFLFYK